MNGETNILCFVLFEILMRKSEMDVIFKEFLMVLLLTNHGEFVMDRSILDYAESSFFMSVLEMLDDHAGLA